MTKIDSTRLTQILRSMVTSKSSPSQGLENRKKTSAENLIVKPKNERSLDDLKDNIRLKLSQLNTSSANFDTDARALTLHEIILWEMGDSVLENPDLTQVISQVASSIESHEGLATHMSAVIKTFLDPL